MTIQNCEGGGDAKDRRELSQLELIAVGPPLRAGSGVPARDLSQQQIRKETALTGTGRNHYGSDRRVIAEPMRSTVMRLDGQVAAVIHDEKQSIGSVSDTVALRERAQCMARLVEEMGLIGETDTATVGYLDSASVLEPIKPTFTREAGSSPWTDSAARNTY